MKIVYILFLLFIISCSEPITPNTKCKDKCLKNGLFCEDNKLIDCNYNKKACLEPTIFEDCSDSNKICDTTENKCVEKECADECDILGSTCSGNNIISCGVFDNKTCYTIKIINCEDNNQICKNGECVDKCTENEIQNSDIVCGLNDEGFIIQKCINGQWQDTENCSGEDVCVNEETKEGSSICGVNHEGLLIQKCINGLWEDTQECTGTDVCVINSSMQEGNTSCGLNNEGVLLQECINGQWQDTENCTGTDACTNGNTRNSEITCGLNNEGFLIQKCISGQWQNTQECTGTNICLNNNTKKIDCNEDRGLQAQTCNNGEWINNGNCNCKQGYNGVNCENNHAFTIIVKTDNIGVSGNNEFTIPTYSSNNYNYKIDCNNDGIFENNIQGNYTCTYDTPGIYKVRILGTFPAIYFNKCSNEACDNSDAEKLLSIENWGNQQWKTMASAFRGCSNLVINASDVPDLSQATNMSYMFDGASSFNNDISNWNVSKITNMVGVFDNASSFNQDLSAWDMKNVTIIQWMFYNASNFNGELNWANTSKIENMNGAFYHATSFNQDISSWDTSKVTDMTDIFSGASNFNQDLSNWDVGNVNTCTSFSAGATSWDDENKPAFNNCSE